MGPASMTAFIPSTIRCLKQNLMQTTITLIAALGLSAQADELSSYRCYEIEGAKIIAEDGTYHDASGSGDYEITEEGVCYPGTDFGCYQATIDGTALEWMKDGESAGTGEILDGDALDLMPQ